MNREAPDYQAKSSPSINSLHKSKYTEIKDSIEEGDSTEYYSCTPLYNIDCQVLPELLKNLDDKEPQKKYIKKDQFNDLVHEITTMGRLPALGTDKSLIDVFNHLDPTGEEIVQKDKLASALIMLSKGDLEQKIRLQFAFLCGHDSNRLSKKSLAALIR